MKASANIGISILSFTILLFTSAFVYAVENPAIVEKPAVICPAEFDINDPGWALHRIDSAPQENYKFFIERVRIFSYFPDLNPEQRIFIGIKKLWNPDCVAKLGSYGVGWNDDGKKVWSVIQTPTKTTFFLWQGNDSPLNPGTLLRSKPDIWQSGDRITGLFDCKNIKECEITFVLYKDGAPIALRKLPISN